MQGKHPDKTFGLKSSTDLYLKLLYDIDRLRSGRGTKQPLVSVEDLSVLADHLISSAEVNQVFEVR